jgi:hypothetical protein
MFMDLIPSGRNLLISGITALANYTNIAEGAVQYFAISTDELKQLQKANDFPEWNNQDGNYCLEVWSYEPKSLGTSEIVDPLSLFLSMRIEKDERIEISLEQLIHGLW